MDRLAKSLALAAALSVCPAGAMRAAPVFDPAKVEMVDLGHALSSKTLYWPTSPSGFELKELSHGETPGGFFYSANSFCAPEHGGTHLDSPIHFAERGHTVDQIALANLIATAVVIDVAAKAGADADYRLGVEDVAAFEKAHGRIARGSMVLLRTGWDERYGDRKRYFGDDKPGDASNLHFPSYGAEAATLLVKERGVVALGVDTPSIDHGPSSDFPVHRMAGAANVPGFENMANLGRLPATGAVVVALPMNIAGGSGAPLRVVALLPKE